MLRGINQKNMKENLENVQVQYFTPSEFADAVRKAISDKSTQAVVAELLGIKQNNLASSIHRARNNKGYNFALLARAYETVVPCYDIGRRHNGDVFVVL